MKHLRLAAMTILVSALGWAAPSLGHADTASQVINKFTFQTLLTFEAHVNGKPAVRVETLELDKPRGSSATLVCQGCRSVRHTPLRRTAGSNGVVKLPRLGWLVSGSAYIEADIWQDGHVGRWQRLQLALHSTNQSNKGRTCFRDGRGKRGFACLLLLRYGCLSTPRTHTQCPAGTPVPNVDQVAGGTPAPETNITSGPSGLTNQASGTFTYTTDTPGGSFECHIDKGQWVVCPDSGQPYALGDGQHVFEVRAVDSLGQRDPSPAHRSWGIDTTPPQTTLTSGPGPTVQSSSATFTYASSEGGSHFQCDFDHQGWSECDGGRLTLSFGLNNHSLAVRAIDDAGNVDPDPPSVGWTRYPDNGTEYLTDDQDASFVRGGPSATWYTGSGGGPGTFSYFANYEPCPPLNDTEDNRHNADWSISGLPAGQYDVYAWIPMAYDPSTSELPGAPLTSQAQYTINSHNRFTITNGTVDQLANAGQWAFVASVGVTGDADVSLDDYEGDGTSCERRAIAADAVKFVYRYYDGG